MSETATASMKRAPAMGRAQLGDVLVTGGASGLGAAIARAVGEAGGSPIVVDRNQPSPELEWRQADLGDTRSAEQVVREIVAERGGIDGVVTAAGIDACGQLGEVDGAAWERVIAVNLMGTAAVVRAALPALQERRGRVVTVASTLGLRALSDATAYCASKFGVVGFTRALAAESAGRIGVTLLIPGGMQTAFFDGREDRYKPPPDARLAPPEEVAAAVVFALSRPPGVEVRELVVCPSTESSWP